MRMRVCVLLKIQEMMHCKQHVFLNDLRKSLNEMRTDAQRRITDYQKEISTAEKEVISAEKRLAKSKEALERSHDHKAKLDTAHLRAYTAIAIALVFRTL